MPIDISIALGGILALAATIVLLILVLPPSKDGKLPNQFLQFLHDALNFKILFIESILKAIYVFLTCLSILVGFFLLFSRVTYDYGYYGNAGVSTSTFWMGLVLLILGPVLLRISYEVIILLVTLVINAIELTRKRIDAPSGDTPAPETPPQPEPVYLYCTQCGTRYDITQGDCPNCGKTNTP